MPGLLMLYGNGGKLGKGRVLSVRDLNRPHTTRRQVLIDLGRKTGEFRRFSLFFAVFLAFLKIEKSVKQKDAFGLFRVVTRI